MSDDYPGLAKDLMRSIGQLRKGIPETMEPFGKLGQAVYGEGGALDHKTRELIALAIAIAIRCDGCIAFHARAVCEQDATRQEVLDTISVAIHMGGGSSLVYSAEALRAYDQFLAERG